MLDNARIAFNNGKFDLAFEELQYLDNCDREGNLSAERKQLLGKLYEAIKKQREDALRNTRLANKRKIEAEAYAKQLEKSWRSLLYLNLNRRRISATSAREKAVFYNYVAEFYEKDTVKRNAWQMNQATSYFQIENFEAMDTILNEVLNRDSLDITALDLKCLYHLYTFDPSNSLKYGLKVLEIEPKRLNTLMNVGLALGHLGRYEEALTYIDKGEENMDDFVDVNFYSLVLPELEEISMSYKIYLNKAEYRDHLILYKISLQSYQSDDAFIKAFDEYTKSHILSLNTALVIMNLIEIQLKNKSEDIGGLVLEARIFEDMGFQSKAIRYYQKYINHTSHLQKSVLTSYCKKKVHQLSKTKRDEYSHVAQEVFYSNEYTITKATELLWKWDEEGALNVLNAGLQRDSTDFRLYELKAQAFQNSDTSEIPYLYDSLLNTSEILERRFPQREQMAQYIRALSYQKRNWNTQDDGLFYALAIQEFKQLYQSDSSHTDGLEYLLFFHKNNGQLATAYELYKKLETEMPFNFRLPELKKYFEGNEKYLSHDSLYLKSLIIRNQQKLDTLQKLPLTDSSLLERLITYYNLGYTSILSNKYAVATNIFSEMQRTILHFDSLSQNSAINRDYLIKIYLESLVLAQISNYLSGGEQIIDWLREIPNNNSYQYQRLCQFLLKHSISLEVALVEERSFHNIITFLTAVPDNTVGISHAVNQNYDSSISFLQAGLDKLAEDHPYTKVMQVNLSRVYNAYGLDFLNQEKYQEAMAQFQNALDIGLEIQDSTWLAECYNNLGASLKHLGQFDEASERFEQGLKILISLGVNRPEAGNMYALFLRLNFHKADCLSLLKNEEEASRLFLEVKQQAMNLNTEYGQKLIEEIQQKGY